MQPINTVSETALLTLRSRVIESCKPNPVLMDPVGGECLEKLVTLLPVENRERIMERKLSPFLTRHLALRARKYDQLCREFLEEHSDGFIVNLGCGFDTRFWRLEIDQKRYLELDLPEVIRLKREVLGDRITFRILEDSVLEETWISSVKSVQDNHVLFLAEGLFMYFPPDQSINALKAMAGSFQKSRLVMEVVHKKYTQGIYKKMVEQKMRRRAGSSAGDYFLFGIRHGSDLKEYHPSFTLRGEWSFFEDRDIRPAFLRMFRKIRFVAKSQYTVIADIS
jgi:O-methyltransferase involved in polyketide biosynthesis